MKRFALVALIGLGFIAGSFVTSPHAQAGLLGGKSQATPSPSPSPSALPTATPEPPDIAIPRLQAKLKANPNDQQTMVELAGQLLQINRPDVAAQLTQHLIQLGNKTAQVYYLDGYAQQALGNINGAVADLEQASNLDPTNLGVLAQLADLYLRTNRANDAERIAKRAVTFNKDSAAAYEALAQVYAQEQHFDDARAQYEEAIKRDPKDTRALYQIAATYAQQNNAPAALTAVDRVLAIDPHDVQALVFKADLFARQHDDAKTSAAYDDAVVAAADDQQKAAILSRKALYFASESKPQQAEQIFTAALAQYPKVAGLYDAYGDYFANNKQVDKASVQWKAALAIDPNDATALARLSQLAMSQKNYRDAASYLKKLTEINPDAQAFAMLGQTYMMLHDYGSSKDACSKSFQMDRSPQMLGCVAGADFELKNFKEAGQIFDVLDKAAPEFLNQQPQLLYIAGQSYAKINQKSKAVAAYKRLLPYLKKGTKDYNDVNNMIAQLSKH